MSAWVAKKTTSPVATESEAVIALGARTSRLHVEIKRLRAWWREILRKELTQKLAEDVSAATQIDGSPLLLVNGKRHPHLTLLERSKAFVSEGLDGEVLGALHDMVGQAAGVDLECRELAAIIGGCDMGWRTNLLWTPVATNEERQKKPGLGAACLEKGEALGVAMSVLSRGGGLDLNGEAHEIRQVADREQDGDEDGEFRGQSGRVVLYHHDQEEEALKMVTQVRRARSWHRRHPACFLPIAWAVSVSVAASWGCGDDDDDDDQCDTLRKQQKTKTHGSLDGQANGGAVEDGLRRPSPYSILALVAAFLDKESTAKGFISRRGSGRPKAAFGGGRDVTYGKTNPNLGELFLRFCSWVEKLGTGEQPTASLELGADGTLHHWQRGSTSATESNRPKEGEPSKDAPVQLFVNGEPCEDLADVRVSSHLRRTCGRVERALIPDGIRGLRVWNNDPRWSLLGYALARRVAPSKEAKVQEGCEVILHYVDWIEVLLEMCEDPNHPDAGLGMIGFTLTCDSAPTPEWREQVEARNLADVLCARSANEAFAVAELLQSASAGKRDNAVNVQARERGDDSLLGDSDSLGRGSGSDENNEDNEAIDGVPLTAVTLPFPAAAVASPPPLLPGQHLAAMEMGDEGEEEKGINGTPLVLPGPLLHPGPVFPALQSLSPSALSTAPAIGAVIARGDKLLREAASAVAAARNAASKATTRRTPEAQKTVQSGGNDTAVRARQGHDMDKSQDYNSAARDNTEAGERGRSRALAKQRGRERGKQREQELEAEKLKKAEREKDRDAERRRQRRLRQEEYEERVSQRRVRDEERKNESRRFERRTSATDAVRCKGTSRGNSESDKAINDVKRRLSDARTSSKSATCSSRSTSSSSTNDSTSGSRSRSRSSFWKSKSDRCDATSRSPQPTQSGRGDSADGAAEVSTAVDWSPWRSVDSNDSSSVDESSVQETDAAGKVDLGRHRGTEMRRERSVSMGSGRDGVESLGASTGKTSTRQRRMGGQEKGSDDDRVALLGDNERRRASQAVVGGERSARGRGSYRLDGCRGSGSGGRDKRTRSSSMDERRRRRHSQEHGRARSRSPFSLERDGRHSRGHLRQSTRMMSRDREPREVQSRLNGRSRRESSRSRELRLRRAGAWRRGINSRSRSGSRGRSRSRERRFPRSRSRERRRVRSHSRSLSTSLNKKEQRSGECRPSGLPPGHETTRHSNTVPSSSGASTTGKGLLSKGGVKNKNVAPMLGTTPNHAVPPATVSAAAPKERVSSEGGIKNNSAAPQSGAVPFSVMPTIKSAGSQRADAAFGHGSGATTGVFLGADRMSLYKTFLAVDTIEDEDSMEEGEMDTIGDQDGMEEGEMVMIEDQGSMEEGEITPLITKPSKQQPFLLKQVPKSPLGSKQPKKPLLAATAVVAAAAIAEPTAGDQQVQTPPGSKQQPLKLVQKSPPGPKHPKKPLPTAAAAVEATAKPSIASQQVQTRPGSKQQSKPPTQQPVLKQVPISAPGSKQPKKPLPAAAALAKPTVVGEQVPTPPGSKQQPKQPVLKQVPKSPPGSKQLNKKPLPKATTAAATPKPTVAGQQEVQMPPRSKVQPKQATQQSVLKQVPKSPPGSTQPKESLPKATVVAAARAQPTVARQRVKTPHGQGKNYKKNKLRRERKAAAAAAAAVAAKVTARIVVEVTTGGTTNNSDTPAKENAIGDGSLVVSDDRGGDADV